MTPNVGSLFGGTRMTISGTGKNIYNYLKILEVVSVALGLGLQSVLFFFSLASVKPPRLYQV